MKMKKTVAAVLAVVIILAMVLSACGGGGGKPTTLTMATGGTQGTYYGFSGVIANVLNSKMSDKLALNVESTGASQANIQLVETGANNLAIVQNDVMSYAYNGTAMFDGKPVTNFSAVISCYPEIVQIVASSNITQISDLVGKTVSVGASDSGTRYNAEQILNAYGITFDDINVVYESFGDSVDSMKNGAVDACFQVAGIPTTAITELATAYNFNLLEVDDAHLKALQSDYGFYTKITIPANTYSCVTEDVEAVAVMATIIASNDLDEEAVYNFLKGLFDYKDEIAKNHVKGNELDLDTAVSGISIPFHKGAVKYYSEMGKNVG